MQQAYSTSHRMSKQRIPPSNAFHQDACPWDQTAVPPSVPEARRFAMRKRLHRRAALEILERTFHVPDQQLGQVAAETVARDDTLNYGLPAVRWEWIRRHLPAANPKPVAE